MIPFRPVLLAAVLVCGGCAATPEPIVDTAGATEQQSLAAAADAERRGDLDAALVEYVKALAANPQSAEAHYRVARVHAALGNTQTATDAYRRALALTANHAGALEGLGLLLLEQGSHDAARRVLDRAAHQDARRWPTHNALGVLADLGGDHGAARAHFGHALELQPDQPLLLNNLGYSFYLGGDYDVAQDYFERALRADPGNRNAWSNLALVHARRGETAQAVRAMERIMDAPSARYSIGYVCLLDGRLADAETLFDAAIKASGSFHEGAHAALARVREERARAAGTVSPEF